MAWRDLFRDRSNRGVADTCAVCGSGSVTVGTARVILVAVSESGQAALSIDDAQGSGLVCAPLLCGRCGHVQLHSLHAYDP